MAKRISTTASRSQIKPAELRTFHAALARWYKVHGRHDLPWRQTDDPYHIWLSEVMLQQTQVATVRDRFYEPFLKKFPSIELLAAAEQAEVLKAWEGLGYYSRARNLHKAAKQLVTSEWWKVNGRVKTPSSQFTMRDSLVPHLLSLPGIGKNTAHAIAVFAYHQPVAILEANVKRVVARIFALKTPRDAELWKIAEALLNKNEPFDYNQAMMDLGSQICTPKKPRCDACPARRMCRGKGAPTHYPTPTIKKQIPTREVTIYVREDLQGRLFLEKREETLLGGLYGFPQVPIKDSGFRIRDSDKINGTTKVMQRQVALKKDCVEASSPASRVLNPESHLGTVTHTYSHFKLIGQVVVEKLTARGNSSDWRTRAEITALPLSTLDHKVLALVDNCHTRKKKRAKPRNRSAKR